METISHFHIDRASIDRMTCHDPGYEIWDMKFHIPDLEFHIPNQKASALFFSGYREIVSISFWYDVWYPSSSLYNRSAVDKVVTDPRARFPY